MAEKQKPTPTEINYITPAGFRRLADELTFLRSKKRPEVVGALGDAAAEGDRSENAEYIYRKKQLREIDKRLRFLSKRLDDVQIVDPATQPRRDRVFFGATVTVEDEEGEARPTASSASTRSTAPRATSRGSRPSAARCSARPRGTPSPPAGTPACAS